MDFEACLLYVSNLAREAGKIVEKARKDLSTPTTTGLSIEAKENFADLVTKYDVEVETFLRTQLAEKYPSHKFIGEESAVSCHELTDEPTWIIDPIDGTTNFVHGFPFVAISIGFLVDKEVKLGLIYAPLIDKMFTAVLGGGAFCNGSRIHVSSCKDMSKALVVAEFGSDRNPESLDKKVANMRDVIESSHGIRSLGSCALNMTCVALGTVDACFEFGVHCWDMAAGDIIIREAGGVTMHPSGKPLDLMSRCMVCASSKELADTIRSKLRVIEYKRD